MTQGGLLRTAATARFARDRALSARTDAPTASIDPRHRERPVVSDVRPEPIRFKPCGRRRTSLRHVGLFAGIGGIERGLQQAGHRTLMLCEKDEAASAVLRRKFPGVRLHDDIRSLLDLPRGTDMISAGFPCQDLSQVGRTRGLSGQKSSLVAHLFRLLENRSVPWVLLENVPFMLHLERGHAMTYLIERFEELGYKWAYRVVDTMSFGLPHRRQRVFLIASLSEDPRHVLLADDVGPPPNSRSAARRANGFYWTEGNRGLGWAVDAIPTLKPGSGVGVPSPPAIVMPDGLIGKPSIRDAERLQGFPSGWTTAARAVVADRHRWRLVGNSVSVPVSKWIGRRLSTQGDLLLSDVRKLDDGERWPSCAWNSGDGRYCASVSPWPVHRKRQPARQLPLGRA